jgi:aspartate-semialdehyde dehydrogenase
MKSGLFRAAIVGASTLKGKELAEMLDQRRFPAVDIKLLDDDESLGQLGAVRDELSVIQGVRPGDFEGIDFTFFCSEPEFTRKHWKSAERAGSTIIDLSYALEDEGGARVRSPWLEEESEAEVSQPEAAPAVIAHPAAVALALLSLRAQRAAPIRSSVATVFEPASEHGRRGMDELHEQTINLLSFQKMPTAVYDAQVAFNLLARYGGRSSPALASLEQRVTRHFERVAGGRAPVPSVMLLQAPIFHGYAFSFYVEVERATELSEFVNAVSGAHVRVPTQVEDSPSNIGVAGQDEVIVSVKRDLQRPNAFWIWGVVDNLRLAAASAVQCAEAMLAMRPQGTVQ